jgi:hypothetical protein
LLLLLRLRLLDDYCCCACFRLDISPLQDLAKQNYSAEIIKYAGGSPLSGMGYHFKYDTRAMPSCFSDRMCFIVGLLSGSEVAGRVPAAHADACIYSATRISEHSGYLLAAGKVPPGGAAVFSWLFQPLEAKDYSVALPLVIGSQPPQPLLIHGRGYHPTQHPQQAAPSPEEAAQ